MSTVIMLLIPIAAIALGMYISRRTLRKTGNASKTVKRQILVTFGMAVFCMSITALTASADSGETATAAADSAAALAGSLGSASGLGFIAAALAIGLSAIGAGIALAAGAPAAIGAISENPQSFGKAMIFVVLGEAVALYGFVIAFMIIAKLPSFTDIISSLV